MKARAKTERYRRVVCSQPEGNTEHHYARLLTRMVRRFADTHERAWFEDWSSLYTFLAHWAEGLAPKRWKSYRCALMYYLRWDAPSWFLDKLYEIKGRGSSRSVVKKLPGADLERLIKAVEAAPRSRYWVEVCCDLARDRSRHGVATSSVRKSIGMTQEQFATRFGVSIATLPIWKGVIESCRRGDYVSLLGRDTYARRRQRRRLRIDRATASSQPYGPFVFDWKTWPSEPIRWLRCLDEYSGARKQSITCYRVALRTGA